MKSKQDVLVQDIIGSLLFPMDFKLSVERRRFNTIPKVYSFTKKINIELWQEICIYQRIYMLELRFITNAYGQMQEDAGIYLSELKGMKVPITWQYSNNKEFQEILEEFKQIIIDYGFDLLEKISIPTTDVRPTRKSHLYLYKHYDEIVSQYSKEWGVAGKTETEQVERLCQLVEEQKGRTFQEAEPELIKITALFIDFILVFFGGRLVWSDAGNSAVIEKTGKKGTSVNPLLMVIVNWSGEYGGGQIKQTYDKLKE